MNTLKIYITILFIVISFNLWAQQGVKVKGRVLGPDTKPIPGAVISGVGLDSTVQTDEQGLFEITVSDKNSDINIWADGYYSINQHLLDRSEINVILIPESRIKYNEKIIMPFRNEEITPTSLADNLARKDMIEYSSVDKALSGNFSGLRVVGKSGMPGEGSYMNLRGIRSFLATNEPLIVINGVPFLPDTEMSPVISGYSRDVFSTLALRNIENVTLLKGADAAIYGSMGSNGVLMIETSGASGSSDLETKITFAGQYGVNWNKKRFPMLDVSAYKAYLTDIGTKEYPDMADLFAYFPFLQDDPSYFYNFRYNNNTNWQNEIYKPSFITDNYFRVEGGDAIAKYDLSFGYQKEGGILENTNKDRYYTLLNSLITVSRKIDIFATAGLGYSNSTLQEQGMIPETNPVLAAYAASPVISPYIKDSDNNTLSEYNVYYYGVSNPKAITNTLNAKTKDFDFNLRAGLNYRPTDFLTFNGQVGINYFYNQEQIFIPGKTSMSVLPLNNGLAENTVRNGVAEAINMYYNVNGAYKNIFNDIHVFNAMAGMQILTSRKEFDAGAGYNTANDFYQTLDNTETSRRYFTGYINTWNWMNFFGHVDYTYNNQVKTSVNLAVDGSSSSGTNANRFGVFPSASVVWMLGNSQMLINSNTVNRLNLRAEYGLTGNSRFSSNFGKNYYVSAQYQEYSGIIRSGVPNTKLKWEKHLQFNVGADLSLLYNRLSLSFDYYNIQSRDVVFNQPISSVFGTANYYANSGKLKNDGFELSLQASLIDMNHFVWLMGGNIAFQNSKVKSLGRVNERITTFDDGSAIITKVGEKPYAFYGWEANGVYSSTTQAHQSGLANNAGETYSGGDVRIVDQNDDKVINDNDKVILGSALPNYFGGFYTQFSYKNFSLLAEFTFSQGNKAYNAVRRYNESMNSYNNQSSAVLNRWQLEGQITDIPRAEYGDPMNNNAFSSRWIEDASYLKIKNITLSYSFNKSFLGFFQSGTLYVTGENLHTFTKYLGLDPEFAYSFNDAYLGFDYAKVMLPRSVKFGVNLKF